MTKKRSSEISADENQEIVIFSGKGKIVKFSSESEHFSKIGGKSETGGNASWSQGGWTPLSRRTDDGTRQRNRMVLLKNTVRKNLEDHLSIYP